MKPAKVKKESSPAVSRALSGTIPIPIPLLLVCALGILAYVNSLHVPFVFDDAMSVERNPGVRFGDYLSDSLLWTRSLLYITFTLNHRYGGMNVVGYHAVNLLLHLLNGTLVFFIARRIFLKAGVSFSNVDWAAGLSAAFFLLHPVQTESVTYVSSRSELLSTFFYAAALLIFIRWPEPKIGFLLAIILSAFYALGMGSKETVISLPASFVLYDFIFISKGAFRPLLRRWRFYSVFLALGAAGCVYLFRQWRMFFQPDPSLLSPWRYFLTETRVIVHYIQLLIFPVGQNLDYDFRSSVSIFEPTVLLSLALLATIVGAAFYWRRSHPIVAFSILWFFLTLGPTSSFAPIQDVIFEHRLYLPLVGMSLLLPVLIRPKVAAWGIVALLLAGTIFRNDTWGDDIRLYNDIAQKSPAKARAYNALTLAYIKKGQVDQAVATAKTGIANVPGVDKYDLYTILGNLYLQSGRYDDAIRAYKSAAAGNDPAVVYNNLGIAYFRSWQQLAANRTIMTDEDFKTATSRLLSQAESAFLESYRRDPSNLPSLDTYIDVRHSQEDADKWRLELTEKLSKGEAFDTLYSLGKLAWLDHDYGQACTYFERALQLNSGEKLLLYNYAYALEQVNRTNDAIAEYLKALRRDPTFWEAHYNVSLLYIKNGDSPDAIAHLNEVLRLRPGDVPTLMNLARIFMKQNESARARFYLKEALQINPQNAEALNLLQRLGS
jgi:tetratricopeptide (TPR) repeat protein